MGIRSPLNPSIRITLGGMCTPKISVYHNSTCALTLCGICNCNWQTGAWFLLKMFITKIGLYSTFSNRVATVIIAIEGISKTISSDLASLALHAEVDPSAARENTGLQSEHQQKLLEHLKNHMQWIRPRNLVVLDDGLLNYVSQDRKGQAALNRWYWRLRFWIHRIVP